SSAARSTRPRPPPRSTTCSKARNPAPDPPGIEQAARDLTSRERQRAFHRPCAQRRTSTQKTQRRTEKRREKTRLVKRFGAPQSTPAPLRVSPTSSSLSALKNPPPTP